VSWPFFVEQFGNFVTKAAGTKKSKHSSCLSKILARETLAGHRSALRQMPQTDARAGASGFWKTQRRPGGRWQVSGAFAKRSADELLKRRLDGARLSKCQVSLERIWKSMFNQILFPVDFSERSIGAAPHVKEMAAHFGSKVSLLNVIDLMRSYSVAGEFGAAYAYEMDTESMAERLRAELDTFGKEHLPDVCRGIYVEDGDPANVITRFAQERSSDLIMMPSHGYGPFRSLLLGSVTAKVLHDSECPVWTGAHLQTMPAEGHLPYRNVLCAVDLSPRSTPLIQWAGRLAGSFNASLRVVHAVQPMEPWAEYQVDCRFEEDLRQDAHRKIAEFQKEAGIATAPVCVATGSVGEVVAEEAKRHDIDLVVIGRGCLQEKLGRLRTHAYSIIRQAPCPVISI
jgi:nucleotide-binding universal stress UspA family protein